MPVQVYDATSFLKEHPGGGDSILLVAGTDATEEFDAIHSQKAKQQLLSFVVGTARQHQDRWASMVLLLPSLLQLPQIINPYLSWAETGRLFT